MKIQSNQNLGLKKKLSISRKLNLKVCCSGDILAALPEPTAEPVVEEPVKIQCPSYRFFIVIVIDCGDDDAGSDFWVISCLKNNYHQVWCGG